MIPTRSLSGLYTLSEEVSVMKVVVVKSPKMFTGLLRMMFGIKKSETV